MVKLLVGAGADVDSQDNRKVFCLMASFRKVRNCTFNIADFDKHYSFSVLYNVCMLFSGSCEGCEVLG